MKNTYKKHLLLSASCLALGFFSIPDAKAASTCPGAQLDPVECPGTESRVIRCMDFRHNVVADSYCAEVGVAPQGSRPCTAQCPAPDPIFSNAGDGGGGDPLIFDMDGNGISLLSCADGVMFDIDNDGELDQTGWTDGRDGLLAIDKNRNGKIDSQSELFGNVNAPSYQHLAKKDKNKDNIIDNEDRVWNRLIMWVDSNIDGISQKEEMKTMEEVGIESINVDYNSVEDMSNENRITARGTFTRVLRGGERVVRGVAEAFLDYFSGDD